MYYNFLYFAIGPLILILIHCYLNGAALNDSPTFQDLDFGQQIMNENRRKSFNKVEWIHFHKIGI